GPARPTWPHREPRSAAAGACTSTLTTTAPSGSAAAPSPASAAASSCSSGARELPVAQLGDGGRELVTARRRHRDAVPAVRLGRVQRLVGRLEQPGGVAGVLGETGDPARDGGADGAPVARDGEARVGQLAA